MPHRAAVDGRLQEVVHQIDYGCLGTMARLSSSTFHVDWRKDSYEVKSARHCYVRLNDDGDLVGHFPARETLVPVQWGGTIDRRQISCRALFTTGVWLWLHSPSDANMYRDLNGFAQVELHKTGMPTEYIGLRDLHPRLTTWPFGQGPTSTEILGP
jgi:hypothetical protein